MVQHWVCPWVCEFIVVPHVTDDIQEWVTRVAQLPVPGRTTPTSRKDMAVPDVCIIEVSSTAQLLTVCAAFVSGV